MTDISPNTLYRSVHFILIATLQGRNFKFWIEILSSCYLRCYWGSDWLVISTHWVGYEWIWLRTWETTHLYQPASSRMAYTVISTAQPSACCVCFIFIWFFPLELASASKRLIKIFFQTHSVIFNNMFR